MSLSASDAQFRPYPVITKETWSQLNAISFSLLEDSNFSERMNINIDFKINKLDWNN